MCDVPTGSTGLGLWRADQALQSQEERQKKARFVSQGSLDNAVKAFLLGWSRFNVLVKAPLS